MTAGAGRGRDALAVGLAVVAAVALLLGNVAWWVGTSVYDTPTVTREAAELLGTAATTDAVTALLVERVVRPGIEQGRAQLPGIVSSLPGGLEQPAVDLAAKAVDAAVRAEATRDVATRLVAEVNDQLVRGTGPIALTPTQLVAVVAPGLRDNAVVGRIVEATERSGCCTVTFASREQLPFVWRHVEAIRLAAILLPLVALAAGVLAVVVARRRWRAGLAVAGAVVVAGAVTLLALAAGARWGVEGVGDPDASSTGLVRTALRATFDVTVANLRRQSWVLVGLGLVSVVVLVAVRLVRRAGPTVPA